MERKRKRKRKHRIWDGGVGWRWREWGRQGTSGYNRQSKLCAGDWESVAGKVTVQQAIIISEPLLTEVGEQDKWKGIVLTQGRAEGCWEATCWERLRNHQGMLKTLADSCEVQPLTFPIYLFDFLWQLDGHVCTVEHVGYPCAYHAEFLEEGKCDWHPRHRGPCCQFDSFLPQVRMYE